MMKTRKFVPLATIIGGFVVVIIDGLNNIDFTVNEGMFSALVYAGLGSSAAVGFAQYWKRSKKPDV